MADTDHSTFIECREALTDFEALVQRLPLESIHRANPVLGLIHQLRGRIGEVEREHQAWSAEVAA